MNLEHFKHLLRDKARELESAIADLESQSGASADVEKLSLLLEQVQDALHRLDNDAYGKCILCGREIEIARLEAVPWASFCQQDQEKQDRKSHLP